MASHAAEVFGGCVVRRPSQPVHWGIGQIVGDPGRIARLRGVAVGLYSGWKRAEVEGEASGLPKWQPVVSFGAAYFLCTRGVLKK